MMLLDQFRQIRSSITAATGPPPGGRSSGQHHPAMVLEHPIDAGYRIDHVVVFAEGERPGLHQAPLRYAWTSQASRNDARTKGPAGSHTFNAKTPRREAARKNKTR